MNTILSFKKIKILSLLILLSGFMLAQTTVGIKGGVNFSNYGGTDLTNSYKERITIPFGLVAQMQTNSWFSLQGELNFDPKGAKYNLVKTSSSYYTEEYKDFVEKLNYLSLPILAKFDIGSKYRIFGYAGLYFSYLLSANISGTYIKTNSFAPFDQEVTEVDRDYKSDISSFDMGAVFGLGADFSITEQIGIFIDGRFNWGWMNVAQQGQGKIFNDIWSINLGVVYKLQP